jgi:hypothetical protein
MSSLGILVLLSQLSGNFYAEFGPDLNFSFYSHKFFTVGYTDKLTDIFDYQIEGGGWKTSYEGERSSLYTSYQIGVKTDTPFYARFFTGPALISTTDQRLSSAFQFKHDLGVGFKDKRNVGIGVNYSHVSNANLKLPNLGRDFLQLRVEVPFN